MPGGPLLSGSIQRGNMSQRPSRGKSAAASALPKQLQRSDLFSLRAQRCRKAANEHQKTPVPMK
jgi:hypothetical protein